ncbi:glycoside hydrolase family 3 N-terminal domain-containing protein [Enterococcus sp. BWR-S5]|uniref:glycoside hydrolase family 3 N-terminal domain-containing protein n=1 Tax=Enterococcus sp. BWR-S5 TaxID=2787714 RepID=UPI00192095E9|nr:glycoside hydrolase family 3 N-terminal domain-containing protein [Enterococcus sp. BWR-S5]MBL1224090.1 glycoside hydrolase family 3 C-terminal domain-containing protein [Enterococcus sp. BWR-S5]
MKKSELKELMNEMTLAEKIGQLVQVTPDFFNQSGEITGPAAEWQLSENKLFQIGSVLGTHTAEQVATIQKSYLEESRLKIPLLFMADVIHGYETIFPIPLALASSFSSELTEEVARLSALEATRAGVHVTFSPMADHVMDSRWGRVLESNGEDPILSAELTRGYVRGYQGTDLETETERLAACVKHFIGYGAVQGGRDYNHVDLSPIELYQNYLPAFQAAIEEGVKLVMTSFNPINGQLMSLNRPLIKETLRQELGFNGVVISDWNALEELLAHRVVGDKQQAAAEAFEAGTDIDMMSDCYINHLAEYSDLDSHALDEAVYRILKLKNELGLFENPFRGIQEEAKPIEGALRIAVKEAAMKSFVLLKNDSDTLPIRTQQQVFLLGPKASSKDILGAWSWIGKTEQAIDLAEGLTEQLPHLTVGAAESWAEPSEAEYVKLSEEAKASDVVILALGESSEETGEAASKAEICLPEYQIKLVKRMAAANKNLVVVLFNGRPLDLTAIEPYAKSIVEVWFPGSEGGRAIAETLIGQHNPEGKLPMSFPRAVGQLPFSYQAYSTGRPLTEQNQQEKYVSKYMDVGNEPLYPFGHGLSYSKLSIEAITQSAEVLTEDEPLTIQATVRNDSAQAGNTTVQLYVEDQVSELVRPVKELKSWQQLTVAGNTTAQCTFTLTAADLGYVHSNLTRYPDLGKFRFFVGLDSQNTLTGQFELCEKSEGL